MALEPGWLRRVAERVSADVRDWPAWMREAAGLEGGRVAGRIYYDRRTKTYKGEYYGNGETLSIGEHATEGEAQLAYLGTVYRYAGTTPARLLEVCQQYRQTFLPPTEDLETPNPLEKFSDKELRAEVRRRRRG